MEEKRLTIKLSNERSVALLFTRAAPTATWICQAADELLTDVIKLFENEVVQSK